MLGVPKNGLRLSFLLQSPQQTNGHFLKASSGKQKFLAIVIMVKNEVGDDDMVILIVIQWVHGGSLR